MEILPLQFKTLQYCGFWSENIAFSFLKSIYKVFVIFLIFSYTLSNIIQFVRNYLADEDAISVLYLAVPYTAISIKILNYTVYTREITNLRNKFSAKICQPNSETEKDIFKKYKRESDILFLGILCYNLLCAFGFLTLPIFKRELKNFTLPLDTYQPYPISNWTFYSFTYAWQAVASLFGIMFHSSSDTMLYGFVLLICAEYDIFCHRIMDFGKNNENSLLKNYIHHHIFIQELTRELQAFFMRTVIIIFCSSLITLGASIYNAIQVSLFSAEFLMRFSYYTIMLTQIFLYCWYGDKLTEKSQSVVYALYSCNWTKLNSAQKRGLNFIMLLSTKGNIMSHHGLCVLNLNTFTWVLKASYTALNVLQRV